LKLTVAPSNGDGHFSKLLFVIQLILNLDNEILFGILSHSFNHNFAFHLLIPYFTIIKIPLEIDGKATTSASPWPDKKGDSERKVSKYNVYSWFTMLNVKVPPEILAYCKRFMSETRLRLNDALIVVKTDYFQKILHG
jgi:hypothetical protein